MPGDDSVSIHLTDLIAAVVGTHDSTCVIAPLLLLVGETKQPKLKQLFSVDSWSSSRDAGPQPALSPVNLIA